MGRYVRWGLIGCGALSILGTGLVLLLLVVGLLAGAPETETLGGVEKTPNEGAQENAPAAEAGEETIIVRVSGTQGVRYSGTYGRVGNSRSVSGVLGAEPVDYPIEGVKTGAFDYDYVDAFFSKDNARPGTIRVELIRDGRVVNESETSAQYGSASVSWSPQDE